MQDCGECTLCCKLLRIKEINSKAGEYCSFCNPGIGCQIYNQRPESCRIFLCAWKQMDNVGEELRPDKCKMLFEKWSDKVMVGGTDHDEISDLTMGQIDSFRSEGISVLVVNHILKTRTFFLAPGHTIDFIKREINASTKLFNRPDHS